MADNADRTGGRGASQAPAAARPSAEERKKLLARRVSDLTRENRASLRSQGDFEAALVRGKPTNHVLMFVTLACVVAVTALGGRILGDMGAGVLAALLAGGLFAAVWLVLALTGGEEIERLSIDERGAIMSVKSGRSVDTRGDFIRIAGPCAVLVMCAFLGVSLIRDIVNPPPPNCHGNATARKDSDVCLTLPNLANLLNPTPTPTASATESAAPSASAAPLASASPAGGVSPSPSGSSSGGSGWTVGNEKLVELGVRIFQLLFVIVVAVPTAVFLWMMLTGQWVFGIRPVRRRRGDG